MKEMQNIDELFVTVRLALSEFGKELPNSIVPGPEKSKLPFQAACFLSAALWRVEELARTAFGHFEAKQHAAALTLTRASFETSAALWYLFTLIDDTLVPGASLEKNGKKVVQLLIGSKDGAGETRIIHMMDIIRRISKDFERAEECYAGLCEYAHPNYRGTAQQFVTHVVSADCVEFGPRARDGDANQGLTALMASLKMATAASRCFDKRFVEFVQLCEKSIEP
jgi:hypothetical protein